MNREQAPMVGLPEQEVKTSAHEVEAVKGKGKVSVSPSSAGCSDLSGDAANAAFGDDTNIVAHTRRAPHRVVLLDLETFMELHPRRGFLVGRQPP